jgi:hypothetical protein
MKISSRLKVAVLTLFMTGCAGLDRGISSCSATQFGSNWIVVELTEAGGKPYRCWELNDVALSSETQSDGIFWKDAHGLVHVSGSYDYIQVTGGDWDEAFKYVNLTRAACKVIRESFYDPIQEKYVHPGAAPLKPTDIEIE